MERSRLDSKPLRRATWPRARALAAAAVGLGAVVALQVPALASGTLPDNIPQTSTFTDALGGTTMTITFDGTHYWTSSGGSTGGQRLAEYSASGTLVSKFSPNLDFRSIFTDGAGQVFARQYSNATIYHQTSPGVFAAAVTLTGASINSQSAVVLNTAGTSYIAQSAGTVTTFALSGAFQATRTLVGWGAVSGENTYPSNRGIAAYNGKWLTYAASSKTLSEWDPATGARIGQAVLTGAGTSLDSGFSFSYTRGQAWVVDIAGAAWRGFALASSSTSVTCSPATVPVMAPTTCTATVTDTSVGAQTAPTGTVAFSAGTGAFSGSPCTLAAATANSSSCQATYTPAVLGKTTVTATYAGGSHGDSAGTFDVTAAKRATAVSVGCSPASVTAGGTSTCTATVSDTDPGTKSAPTGTVTFGDTAAGATFTPSSCTLAQVGTGTTAACSSTYAPSAASVGTDTVSAAYSGDASHAASSGTMAVTVNAVVVPVATPSPTPTVTPALPKAGSTPTPAPATGFAWAIAIVGIAALAARLQWANPKR